MYLVVFYIKGFYTRGTLRAIRISRLAEIPTLFMIGRYP